jgi:hypothetical protein
MANATATAEENAAKAEGGATGQAGGAGQEENKTGEERNKGAENNYILVVSHKTPQKAPKRPSAGRQKLLINACY